MRLKKDHENKRKELEEKLKSEREERMKVEEERRVWMDKYEKLLEKAKRWGLALMRSDDESAGETLYPKMNSKRDEPDGFLTVDGVAKKPQMLKRKQAPSPNIGNNEFDDEDSVLDRIPISELIIKKCKKLMSSSSLASDFSDHGKQAKPSKV
ncbi:hypothetical protein ACLB2K_051454 [Fragaria x ananassa]